MSRAQAAPRAFPAARHSEDRSHRTGGDASARGSEARRRRLHYARRRRDLAIDCLAGVVVALLAFALTSGLGIVLLLLIPLVGILIAAALARRGVPQRILAAWRAWAWARVDARERAMQQRTHTSEHRPRTSEHRTHAPSRSGHARPSTARTAPARRRPQGALWEEVAEAADSRHGH